MARQQRHQLQHKQLHIPAAISLRANPRNTPLCEARTSKQHYHEHGPHHKCNYCGVRANIMQRLMQAESG